MPYGIICSTGLVAAIWQWQNFDLSLDFNDQGALGIADSRTFSMPATWNLQRVIATWADAAGPAGAAAGVDYNLLAGIWGMTLAITRGSSAETPFYSNAWPVSPRVVQASRDALGIFWSGTLTGGPVSVDTAIRRSAGVAAPDALGIRWAYGYEPTSNLGNPAQAAKMLHKLRGSMRVLLSRPE